MRSPAMRRQILLPRRGNFTLLNHRAVQSSPLISFRQKIFQKTSILRISRKPDIPARTFSDAPPFLNSFHYPFGKSGIFHAPDYHLTDSYFLPGSVVCVSLAWVLQSVYAFSLANKRVCANKKTPRLQGPLPRIGYTYPGTYPYLVRV